MSVIEQTWPFSEHLADLLELLSRLLARLAVFEDRAAVLVHGPKHGFRLAALHGGVQLVLLVGQSEAEDDVWHSKFQKVERRPAGSAGRIIGPVPARRAT
jgi:hypothetical protein